MNNSEIIAWINMAFQSGLIVYEPTRVKAYLIAASVVILFITRKI